MKTAIYYGWYGSPTSEQVGKILAKEFIVLEAHYGNYGNRCDSLYPCDLLFSFGPTIFSAKALRSAQIAAINFHLGPPKYPGRHSAERAIMNQDKEFGVTSHLMDHKIDHGQILRTIKFQIFENESPKSLKDRAFNAIPELARQTIADFKVNNYLVQSSGETWL